jgi:hypothetical protein
LRLDLRSTLHRAAEELRHVESALIPLREDEQSVLVKLVVEPLVEGGDLAALMVVFQKAGPATKAQSNPGAAPPTSTSSASRRNCG